MQSYLEQCSFEIGNQRKTISYLKHGCTFSILILKKQHEMIFFGMWTLAVTWPQHTVSQLATSSFYAFKGNHPVVSIK